MTSNTDKGTKAPDRQPKRPYTPPEFEVEQVFEVLALTCGKTSSGVPFCQGGGNKHS